MRALCARMGSGHRPGLPSVTAQCDSRAFAGLRSAQVAPEPGGASAVRSSAAESRGQLPPAPRAGESCPPARPPPRKAAGVRSFPLVAVSYSQQGRLWFVPTPGTGGRVYGLLVLLTLRPPGPPWQHAGSGSRLWRRARPVPCCSQTPGAHGSLALPLCRLSPLEVSRSAEPPPWSDSPLPLRTVGGWQGPEPGGVYAQGPSLAQQPLLAPGEVLNP